jgi:hypothetical protein
VPLPSPVVSVVVPAYAAAGHLEACLQGFAAQTADSASFEVIVVDDHSPDETAALAESAGVRVVRHDHNRGAAAARNTGARAARGQVLLFVDSDVIPEPGLVDAVLEAFDRPEVRAATGRYSPEAANPGRFPTYKALWTFWCWERTGVARGESSHLQGALAAVRKELFDSLAGFDESFVGGSVEDYELSTRLRDGGDRIVFCDGMRGRHHFPGFRTVARNYWDRTRMWARLRPDPRGFSSGQASRRSAIGAVCALGSALSHCALPLSPALLPVTVAADLGWLASAAPFLTFVARREGPGFALYAAGVHYALSVVIGAAAASTPLGGGSWRSSPSQT